MPTPKHQKLIIVNEVGQADRTGGGFTGICWLHTGHRLGSDLRLRRLCLYGL